MLSPLEHCTTPGKHALQQGALECLLITINSEAHQLFIFRFL